MWTLMKKRPTEGQNDNLNTYDTTLPIIVGIIRKLKEAISEYHYVSMQHL